MIPVRNALFSIENLDPRLAWLTSYVETMILRDLWTACTIGARIFYMAQRINTHWTKFSDTPMSPFALLDFSSRGTMGYDHSVIGGIGLPLPLHGLRQRAGDPRGELLLLPRDGGLFGRRPSTRSPRPSAATTTTPISRTR
jgi:hypothetical protein